LKQEDTNNLTRSIISNDIEIINKKYLPPKKIPVPDRFTAEFYQTFKEELIPLLLTYCTSYLQRESGFSNSF
jgi:hypothetical protein